MHMIDLQSMFTFRAVLHSLTRKNFNFLGRLIKTRSKKAMIIIPTVTNFTTAGTGIFMFN